MTQASKQFQQHRLLASRVNYSRVKKIRVVMETGEHEPVLRLQVKDSRYSEHPYSPITALSLHLPKF